MRGLLAITLAGLLVPRLAHAKDDKKADDEEPSADEASDEEPDPPDDEEETEGKGGGDKPKPKQGGDSKGEFVKQDLTGHDLAGSQKANLFEKDRFFVDKVDSKKTASKTLIQGSLTSTSFAYRETGGEIDQGDGTASASPFTRLFTDLRLQTDFRHIGGGKWDARSDLRARVVANPGQQSTGYVPASDSSSQSGFLGDNELEIRELWLTRSGKRTDLTFGRQFVADLAGVKFDGLRFDYAQSEKFTLLGFGGLYPIRGSRSVTTDYQPLLGTPDATGNRDDAGRFTGSGGFGAAYRTQNAYGAFGGVALVPLAGESPRVFGTATGYWRAGPKLDFYHFIVLDAVGSNAVNAGLTNLSLGLNVKPDQRLRGTLAFNRIDTETLNVQAQAFLQNPDPAIPIIQNEAFLIRVAQNAARASLSAGLGQLQRFEITVSTALRFRNDLTVTPPNGDPAAAVVLPGGKSIEVYGGITDRHSFKKLRLGVDGSRIFKSGGDSYQRTVSNAVRVFTGRELQDGHGEWEAEILYTKSQDDLAGKMACGAVPTCYGSAQSSAISAGGNLFYRFNRDWFGMTSLFLSRLNVTSTNGMGATKDPPATGVSGFVRIAYRF